VDPRVDAQGEPRAPRWRRAGAKHEDRPRGRARSARRAPATSAVARSPRRRSVRRASRHAPTATRASRRPVLRAASASIRPRVLEPRERRARRPAAQVRASRAGAVERGETRVGPIAVEVIEPLRTLRVRVEPNAHGLEADLVFSRPHAGHRGAAVHLRVDSRIHMGHHSPHAVRRLGGDDHRRRHPQSGRGRAGHRLPRSLVGVRPVGEREQGAPGGIQQFFWLWAPINFDDVCTHFDVNEHGDGRRWHFGGKPGAGGGRAERADRGDDERRAFASAWQSGTRRADRRRDSRSGRTPDSHT